MIKRFNKYVIKKKLTDIKIKLIDDDISYEKIKVFIIDKKTLEELLKYLNRKINYLILKEYDAEY